MATEFAIVAIVTIWPCIGVVMGIVWLVKKLKRRK